MKTVTLVSPRVVNVSLVTEEGRTKVGIMFDKDHDFTIVTLDEDQADRLYQGLDNAFCKVPGCKHGETH